MWEIETRQEEIVRDAASTESFLCRDEISIVTTMIVKNALFEREIFPFNYTKSELCSNFRRSKFILSRPIKTNRKPSTREIARSVCVHRASWPS